jgi:LPXTG-site transpeptidase (sortase) family protein
VESLEQAEPSSTEDTITTSTEWAEVTRIVAASIPSGASELWLGEIVLAAQHASDRAVAWAETRAEEARIAAQDLAKAIRDQGRQEGVELARAGILAPQPKARPLSSLTWPDSTVGQPISATARTMPDLGRRRAAGTEPQVDTASRRREKRRELASELDREPPPGRDLQERHDPEVVPDTWRVWRSANFRRAVIAALAIVVFVLGGVAFEHYATSRQERGAQRRLAGQFARLNATPTRTTKPAFGQAMAYLSVPRIGIGGQVVVEGATLDHLREGLAHESSSQLPGQLGAVVIIGHRQTYGGPFAQLGHLRDGDVVNVLTTTGNYVYRVIQGPHVMRSGADATLSPSASAVPSPGGGLGQRDQLLVLGTGVGSGGTKLDVVVATLDQVGSVPISGSRAGPVRSVLAAVPGQRSGLLLALMWLTGLAAIILWARWLTRATNKVVVSVIAYPVAVAVSLVVIYQVYGALDRLLPGTY